MDIIHAEPNEHPVDELWVWLSVDHKGEGVVAASGPSAIGSMTLMTTTPRLIPALRPLAVRAAKASGVRLRLVRFTRAEIVEEIGG